MQPWKVTAGLTTTLAGLALLLVGSRLEYLVPFWRAILANYGVSIAAHLGLVRVTFVAILYGARRGPSDLPIWAEGGSGRALNPAGGGGSEPR